MGAGEREGEEEEEEGEKRKDREEVIGSLKPLHCIPFRRQLHYFLWLSSSRASYVCQDVTGIYEPCYISIRFQSTS